MSKLGHRARISVPHQSQQWWRGGHLGDDTGRRGRRGPDGPFLHKAIALRRQRGQQILRAQAASRHA